MSTSGSSVGAAIANLGEAQNLHEGYALTCAINTLAGNVPAQGWDAVRAQLKIVESEFNEMKEGILTGDLREFRDGLADLLFTVIGMAHRSGLPLIDDLKEVVRSNLTKFDPTETDALKTKVKYYDQGIATEYFETTFDGKTFYVTRSTKDQTVKGKDYPAGKWLKSYRFEDTQFKPLAADHRLLAPAAVLDVTLAPNPTSTTATPAPVEPTARGHVYPPAELLAAILRRHVRYAHAFVGFLRDIGLVQLYMANWGDARDRFEVCTDAAIRFYNVFTIGAPAVTIERDMIPPSAVQGNMPGSVGWDEIAAVLSTQEAIVAKHQIERLSDQLKGDEEYVLSWHANFAMPFKDASANRIDHALAQGIAGAIMQILFGVDSAPVYWRMHGYGSVDEAIPA